jgi:hypothetical protein
MQKAPRTAAIFLCSALMAIAPGLDLAVQKKALPDAAGFWDACYQAISRTSAAVTADSLSLAAVFCVALWLCMRFLFRKPAHAGAGETLLCALLSGLMLLERAVRTDGSVSLLYANAFQAFKAALYWAGMFLFFLTGLRGLNTLINAAPTGRGTGLTGWMARQTGRSVFLWLSIPWLFQIILKYPGVLMWDTYQQIKQYLGEYTRLSNHPPLGTLTYGLMAKLGIAIGNANLAYFLFTLIQSAAFLLVLAYSLTVMKRLGVNPWIRLGTMFLYAVSPCYAGWATVICKDTQFLILCLWAGVLLLNFAVEGFSFFEKKKNLVALCADFSLLWLTRYNGAAIVTVVFLAMAASALRRAGNRRWLVRVALAALVTVLVGAGGNAALLRALNVKQVTLYDVYSLPFEQTARVVKLHGDDLPADEKAAIDRVLQYDVIGGNYNPWYADAVKDTYRSTATSADMAGYFRVWLRQMIRYPADYLDAAVNLNGVLFDLQFNRAMYVSLTDGSLSSTVYPYSFNDMTMYDASAISGLNAAQRALTQWYFSFEKLPVLGWFATMGFGANVLVMMAYLCVLNGRKKALWALIPSAITAFVCLFTPVAYLRYALPYVCSLPLWFAAYDAVAQKARGLVSPES